jgi:hypothetical protein
MASLDVMLLLRGVTEEPLQICCRPEGSSPPSMVLVVSPVPLELLVVSFCELHVRPLARVPLDALPSCSVFVADALSLPCLSQQMFDSRWSLLWWILCHPCHASQGGCFFAAEIMVVLMEDACFAGHLGLSLANALLSMSWKIVSSHLGGCFAVKVIASL